jgi:flagellar motility protein MotE (MotC chaperone)
MPLAPNATGRRRITLPRGRMPPLRVLQVVVAAGVGLLFLKTMGLVSHGGYIFAGNLPASQQAAPQFARALSSVRGLTDDAAIITGSTRKDTPKKDEPKKAAAAEVKTPTDFRPAVDQAPPAPAPAEVQILQRLRERRDGLDKRAQELEMRENLLKAAEKRIEGRIGGAGGQPAGEKGAEKSADAPALVPDPAAAQAQRMKSLVTIYETMKPKDAARVFDRLDIRDLVQVVNAMNPRKVSDVIAAMSPDVAQKLTVALMSGPAAAPAQEQQPALPPGELPRIDAPR